MNYSDMTYTLLRLNLFPSGIRWFKVEKKFFDFSFVFE